MLLRSLLFFGKMVFAIQFFFFFQAEDGIRDRDVTGVQTCALPISFCSADSAAAGTRAVATHIAGAPSSEPGERTTKKLVVRLCQSTRRRLVTSASMATPWTS